MDTVLAYYVLAVNVVTFVVYGWDKRCAKRGARRVAESTLLGLIFATGVLGGWLAMRVFRHKTRKRSFLIKAVVVTVLNPLWLVCVIWLS